MFMILLGTLFVNSLTALMIFDSGVSRSFSSQSFSRYFGMNIGELECLLWVSITNEHGVSTLNVY